MTPAGFPHSGTPGSTLGCHLPRAYRRLLRPSSALDAKASTMCPSQLVTHTTNPTHPPPHTQKTPTPRPPHPHQQGTATNAQRHLHADNSSGHTRLVMHTRHNYKDFDA